MRERYDAIQTAGGELVAVGTGGPDHVRDFVESEDVHYPVFSDAKAKAARAARLERVGPFRLFHPDSFSDSVRAWKAGHRAGVGRRVNQLGATFVLGPGEQLHYEHYDAHPSDHAPMEEIFAALRAIQTGGAT